MGELTLQFPLHRHVLSDFTSDDQRHSHPSKGSGACELCSDYKLLSHCVLDSPMGKQQNPGGRSYLPLPGLVEGWHQISYM